LVGDPYGEARITNDSTGYYCFADLEPDDYILCEDVQTDHAWHQTCPPPAPGVPQSCYVPYLSAGESIDTLNFGNQRSDVSDLRVTVSGTRARSNHNKTLTILYENIGALTVSNVSVVLKLPPQTTYVSSTHNGNYFAGSDSVTWNLNNLSAGQSGSLDATVGVPAHQPDGEDLVSHADIYPTIGDNTPSNNAYTEHELVCNSQDPNEKHVIPAGNVTIHDRLTYHIDFQNVGNDTAFNIVVKDTLDPNLDLMTLTNMITSHPSTFSIFDRELTWTFTDVNLPDSLVNEPGSNGFVEFSVLPETTLSLGSIIENRASVYFDFNPPVVTNTVHNYIAPPCSYTPGDANGVGGFTGLDVTYSVRFFKGGPHPPYSCDCPPHGNWYVAGDVNGSCSFSGLDVTMMVRHFKTNAAVNPCPDCPPGGLLAPPAPGEGPTPAVQLKMVPTLKAKDVIKASD
jgi:uncharacterized repeat protein (TIGR01451 family)